MGIYRGHSGFFRVALPAPYAAFGMRHLAYEMRKTSAALQIVKNLAG